jgi:hypothetical protein
MLPENVSFTQAVKNAANANIYKLQKPPFLKAALIF